jgi:hypothetical protein
LDDGAEARVNNPNRGVFVSGRHRHEEGKMSVPEPANRVSPLVVFVGSIQR